MKLTVFILVAAQAWISSAQTNSLVGVYGDEIGGAVLPMSVEARIAAGENAAATADMAYSVATNAETLANSALAGNVDVQARQTASVALATANAALSRNGGTLNGPLVVGSAGGGSFALTVNVTNSGSLGLEVVNPEAGAQYLARFGGSIFNVQGVYGGRVGIGITLPSNTLHVVGSSRFDGGVEIGGVTRTNWPAGGDGVATNDARNINLQSTRFGVGEGVTLGADYTFAAGYEAEASGMYGIALGAFAQALDIYSVAIGENSKAEQSYAVAIGKDSWAEGSNSLSMMGGYSYGGDGVAIGKTAQAGTDAIAIGYKAIASSNHSVVIAVKGGGSRTNDTQSPSASSITLSAPGGIYLRGPLYMQNTNGSTKFSVSEDGAVEIGGVPNTNWPAGGGTNEAPYYNVGTDYVSIGNNASGTNGGVAVGYQALARTSGAAVGSAAWADTFGSAIGDTAYAFRSGAAVGADAVAMSYGVAVGRGAEGANTNVAIGAGAKATGVHSVQIGPNWTNDIPNSVSIGNGSTTQTVLRGVVKMPYIQVGTNEPTDQLGGGTGSDAAAITNLFVNGYPVSITNREAYLSIGGTNGIYSTNVGASVFLSLYPMPSIDNIGTNRAYFQCVTNNQYFQVPNGITQMVAWVWGAGNGSAAGGFSIASMPVTPNETLELHVGEYLQNNLTNSYLRGGYPNGGTSYRTTSGTIYSGSGSSSILRGTNLLICAGGAGNGNSGGGISGATSGTGNGGTQSNGGAAGSTNQTAGSYYQGGNATNAVAGNGGGGGYFGGGSGASNGGGGSGFINAALGVSGYTFRGTSSLAIGQELPEYLAGRGNANQPGLLVLGY